MASLKKALFILLALVFVGGIGLIVVNNYSLIFSRHVSGQIVDVQRVNANLAVVSATSGDPGLFSFAVAIRDDAGKIHTASSEDRQWAVAKQGFCADAVFYPYPPWNFEKAGTYMNARLVQLRDCPAGTPALPASAPANGAAAPAQPVTTPPAPQATPAP